jgi:hypothetical protein
MFAGTESSTSVPTPARLRIFSLAAYTHRSPNGNVLEVGVWFATELVKFDSYGAAPGAMPLGFALGPAPLGPLDPCPRGGLAVVRILLLPLRGPSRTALLQVNCTLGTVLGGPPWNRRANKNQTISAQPSERAREGARRALHFPKLKRHRW